MADDKEPKIVYVYWGGRRDVVSDLIIGGWVLLMLLIFIGGVLCIAYEKLQVVLNALWIAFGPNGKLW